ncbi:MAG: SUMF1/EgtB/PvdO family nonheme iron enzyme [Cyanobacteria bacterium J06597_1]
MRSISDTCKPSTFESGPHAPSKVSSANRPNTIEQLQLTGNELRSHLRQQLQDCRALTLKLFGNLDRQTLCHQSHLDFSPIGWHLGHIAMTESMWLLEKCGGQVDSHPDYRQLLLADGLPKRDRCLLPSLSELLDYLADVRERTLKYLEIADIEAEQRLWYFILQHECQHAETASLVLTLQHHPANSLSDGDIDRFSSAVAPLETGSTDMVEIPVGEFVMGCDRPFALDNERCSHRVFVPNFAIDRYPVTQSQFGRFIACEGYGNSEWWSAEGWAWLQSHPVGGPRYWQSGKEFDDHPVCGVSYYEAEAYSKFVGKRLPTEAEWEKAASWGVNLQTKRLYPWGNEMGDRCCNLAHSNEGTTPVTAFLEGNSVYGCADMIGNVWEWTSSWFDGYNGFDWFPYRGYSHTYFDRQHRVLKGGSWATYPWAIRTSFRNWYHPWMRQMFAGFRCASDLTSKN